MGYRSVISIDPGNDTGWAFSKNGIITACGLTTPGNLIPVRDASLIIECPQIYPHDRKIDPNDLIKLAIKVGRAQEFYENLGCRVYQTFPREWKGQVDKEVMWNRAQRELFINEKIIIEQAMSKIPGGKQHNTQDAVELNLWFIKAERIRS